MKRTKVHAFYMYISHQKNNKYIQRSVPKIRQRVGGKIFSIMKKILFFAFIAVSLIFAGCGGPDAPGGGNYGGGYNPPATTGYIQFQNQTSDAYYVEVSGFEPFTLGAKKRRHMNLKRVNTI